MKILSIELSGFKNIEQGTVKTYNFNNHTFITGENFTGKTTICEAFCWLFLGCNINGHTVYEKLLLNTKSQTMYVEVNFIDNQGLTHTLRRDKGETSTIILDGKQINQNQLLSFTGDKDIFMSSFVLGHFERYTPKEARELLLKVLPEVPYEEILKVIPADYSNVLTHSIANKSNNVLKEKRARIKEIEKEQIFLNGQLTVLSETAENSSTQSYSDLSELENKISQYEKNIIELEVLKNTSSTDLLETEKQLLRKQYETLKERLADMNLKTGETCPRCLQNISEAAYHELKKSASKNNAILQAEMNRLIQRGNEVDAQLEKLAAVKSNSEAIDFKINNLKHELDLLKDNYQKRLELKAKEEVSSKSKHSIQEIKARLVLLLEEQKDLEHLAEAISSYNSMRSELQFKNLSQHLSRVRIRLEKLVKSTGELKECFEILYDEKDFMLLSNSERIRTALEISNLINNETGLQLPVFMDNAECITHYDKPDRQIFEAAVKKDSALEVVSI